MNVTVIPKKIPETIGAYNVSDKGGVKVNVVQQATLTADCWLVQMQGFEACASCESYLKRNCGGGEMLSQMIYNHFKDSIYSGYKAAEFWKENPDASFYTFLRVCKEGGLIMHGAIRKYKLHIEQLKTISKEPKGKIDLDEVYPFMQEYMSGYNVIKTETGYHQCYQCDCEKTTEKGTYRDVVIQRTDETLYYYHQHCIVRRIGSTVVLNSAGHRTVTTKERINSYLKHYRLYSDRFKWYLTGDGKEIQFYDGIELED